MSHTSSVFSTMMAGDDTSQVNEVGPVFAKQLP